MVDDWSSVAEIYILINGGEFSIFFVIRII